MNRYLKIDHILKDEHPYLGKMAENLKNHPKLNHTKKLPRLH